jgi:hypothetical protein
MVTLNMERCLVLCLQVIPEGQGGFIHCRQTILLDNPSVLIMVISTALTLLILAGRLWLRLQQIDRHGFELEDDDFVFVFGGE